jgi:hypothetical protein
MFVLKNLISSGEIAADTESIRMQLPWGVFFLEAESVTAERPTLC